jgi:hypothetical protein
MDILARLKAWIDRREKRPMTQPPVERHSCYGCHERFEGPGYIVRGKRYCTELCSPPFLRGNGDYRIAGDPGG